MKVIVLTGLVALAACGAPRDPELERHVLLARQAKSQPPPAEEPAEAGVPEIGTSERPVKTYAGHEISEILDRLEGDGQKVVATFTTDQGVLTCTLDERAPQTVANFVGLASGQVEWKPDPGAPARKTPFYDGLGFHRIVTDFIIQTGNPTGRANAGPGWRIQREQGANELFLQPGALATIDDSGQTHGSQIFITAKADRGLGNSYTAFGRCEPVELVRTISRAEKKANSDGKSPAVPVVIKSLKITRQP